MSTARQAGHLVASDQEQRSPGALEDVELLLGDKLLKVVLAHYSAPESKVTARRFDKILRRLRKKSARLRREPGR